MTDSELTGADRLDEDELGLDPFEGGMDPPERWAEANRHGMTEAEQREGAPLDDRLSEEEPERQGAVDEVGPERLVDDRIKMPERLDDDSVARQLRTPHPEQT